MDAIMGMTIDGYLSLCQELGDLSDLVAKYLTTSPFLVSRQIDRIMSISLPPGSQLAFGSWLGLQPGFDCDAITAALFSAEIGDCECADP
jgi:hypothetical protein